MTAAADAGSCHRQLPRRWLYFMHSRAIYASEHDVRQRLFSFELRFAIFKSAEMSPEHAIRVSRFDARNSRNNI